MEVRDLNELNLRYRPNTQEELPPDNPINTLLKLLTTAQTSKEQGDIGENALLKVKEANLPSPPIVQYGESPGVMAEPTQPLENTFIPRSSNVLNEIISSPTEAPQVSPSGSPMVLKPSSQNAILNATTRETTPITKKPANSLLDYWSQPVIGKMPLDQFVQLAGTLSHAIAPQTGSGRLGAGLAQMGGQAYTQRLRQEDPTNVLRRQLLEKQIKETKTPTEWGAFYKEHLNKINPDTGKTFTIIETLKAFHEARVTPIKPTSHYVNTIENIDGVDTFGTFDTTSEKFTPSRPATQKDIEDIRTGKGKEVTPHWEKVKDPKSPTGWSRQDMNNPSKPLVVGAEPPAPHEKEKTFKDKQIELMWPKLSDEEKKKVLGAGIDPHELTEKNILDMYGNIFTDPAVRKSIQPIAEEIIKRATTKPSPQPGAPTGKIINELPKGAEFIGYGEDGKKRYKVPPTTPGGKPTYLKEQ